MSLFDTLKNSFVGKIIGAVFSFLFSTDMIFSTIAFLVSIFLNFITLGLSSLGLFIIVTPGLNLVLGLKIPMDFSGIDKTGSVNLSGDLAWPNTLAVGLFWSFGFLAAGYICTLIKSYNLARPILQMIYWSIIALWALALWIFALQFGFSR